MRLRTKFSLYILALHLALALLLYWHFKEKLYYFLASECIILLSLYFSVKLYKSFVYPIELIESGQHAIQDEDFTVKYTPTGSAEIDQLIDVYNIMIDQLREEKTLTQEQSYFLENLIKHSPIGMIIMDYDSRIDIINDKASRLFESKIVKGQKMDDIKHPLAKSVVGLPSYEDQVVHLDNQKKYKVRVHEVVHKGFPRQFVLIEEMTAELIEAEKRAYGKVIRMMAHEVNNSMGAVNSILSSISEFDFEDDRDKQDLRESLKIAIDRNEGLAQFTKNFAEIVRLPKPVPKSIDCAMFLTKIHGLFTPQCEDRSINIRLEVPEKTVYAEFDPVLMEQVFSNVIKNSMESIGRKGSIRIRLQANPLQLFIIDDGAGIDPSIESELFSPFFSTKMNGQGIGLMLIRDILMAHNFVFSLKTNHKSGLTTFETSLQKSTNELAT